LLFKDWKVELYKNVDWKYIRANESDLPTDYISREIFDMSLEKVLRRYLKRDVELKYSFENKKIWEQTSLTQTNETKWAKPKTKSKSSKTNPKPKKEIQESWEKTSWEQFIEKYKKEWEIRSFKYSENGKETLFTVNVKKWWYAVYKYEDWFTPIEFADYKSSEWLYNKIREEFSKPNQVPEYGLWYRTDVLNRDTINFENKKTKNLLSEKTLTAKINSANKSISNLWDWQKIYLWTKIEWNHLEITKTTDWYNLQVYENWNISWQPTFVNEISSIKIPTKEWFIIPELNYWNWQHYWNIKEVLFSIK
jgi:hypothetical protein